MRIWDGLSTKAVLVGIGLVVALLVVNAGLAYRNAATTELVAAALGLVFVGALVYLVRRSLNERNRAAALVHEERERLHTTLTSIGDAVIVTDAGGCVTLMNRVAQALTGWKDGAAGRPLGEVFRIVNEQTRQPVESPVTKVIRQGVVVGLANHTALIAKDGGEVPIDDSGAPIRNAGGEIVGVVPRRRASTTISSSRWNRRRCTSCWQVRGCGRRRRWPDLNTRGSHPAVGAMTLLRLLEPRSVVR